MITASHINDSISEKSLDKLGFELIVGITMAQATVATFAPSVQFSYNYNSIRKCFRIYTSVVEGNYLIQTHIFKLKCLNSKLDKTTIFLDHE